MANDLNQCHFIGRLGRDPETRYMPNGDACANFSIAVGESWVDKNSGEKKESTEWVRCVAWRKLGEICGEYLKKGSQVYVSGKMKTRKYPDKDGQEKYITEIVLDRMQMLGSKNTQSGDAPQHEAERQQESRAAKSGPASGKPAVGKSGSFDDLEEIPF